MIHEIIEELFQSFLFRYQIRLDTSTKNSEFVFDCAYLLDHKYHKIHSNRGGSYIDSPDWIKNQKNSNNKSHQ